MRRGALKIAGIYLGFAAIWMVFFEQTSLLGPGSSQNSLSRNFGGFIFALCTAVLLYVLILRFARRAGRPSKTPSVGTSDRYRSLVLATAQVTWTARASGEIIDPQPTWQAFTGARILINTLVGGWMEAIHPDDREHLSERWHKAITRETHPPNDRYYEIEYRVRRHDGVTQFPHAHRPL